MAEPITGTQEERAPQSFLGHTVDVLSRGQYAAMGFLDTMIDSNGTAFAEAFKNMGQEFAAPERRLRFSDLIHKYTPAFADRNPKTTAVLGFVGDVALDPLTYIGTPAVTGGRKFAVGGLARSAKYAAKHAGSLEKSEKALHMLSRIGGKSGRSVNVKLNREGMEMAAEIANETLARGTVLTRRGKQMASGEYKRLRVRGFDHESAKALAEKRVIQLHEKGSMIAESTGMGVTRFDRHVAARMRRGMSMDDAINDAQKGFDAMRDKNYFLAQRMAGVTPLAERATPQLAWETAEKKIGRLLGASPKVAAKVIDTGGISFAGKKILDGTTIRKINDAVGITRAKEMLHDSVIGTMFRRAFSKADVPADLIRLHKNLAGQLERSTAEVHRVVGEIYGGLNKESREKIGRVMGAIDDQTSILGKAAHEQNRKFGSAKAAFDEAVKTGDQNAIAQAKAVMDQVEIPTYNPDRLRHQMIADAKLTTQEHSALAQTYQVMHKLRDQETRVGLLQNIRQNYFPRYWEVARGGQQLSGIRQKLHRYQDMGFFGPGEQRMFTTLDEARKAGMDAIQDAGVVTALRVSDHHAALANRMFNDSANGVVHKLQRAAERGGLSPREHKIAMDRWQYAKRYVQYVGEGDYSNFSEKEVRAALTFYDKAMSTFRRFATVARPAFGVRQVFSNHFQAFIGGGKNAIRHVWDPRATFDAGAMLSGNASKVRIRSVFGMDYSGDDIMALARKYDILRNVTVEGVGHTPIINQRTAPKLMKEIHRNYKIKAQAEKVMGKKGAQGMTHFFTKSLNYTHWPAAVEYFSRLQMFTNMLRSGHSPEAASKLVDDALFDYLHGLTQFERRTMRRLVPFYSFQRFAIPLVTQAAVKAPGRIKNATNAGKTLMEVYAKMNSDEKLTQAEREVIPGWILDQPSTFAGFDDEMKGVFKTFNNFTPLDVFGFLQTDETGKLDERRTLLQASLSQLTPFVKVPMEGLLGEDFFTGRSLDNARNIGDVEVDKVLGHLVGVAVAGSATADGTLMSGWGGVAAGKMLSGALGALPLEDAKQKLASFLGIEEGVDREGKRTVYMNAYALHTLTSFFPALQEAFKLSREDKSPWEKTERFLFGIPRFKVDLQQAKGTKFRELQRGVREGQRDIRTAAIQQRMQAYEVAKSDLTQWVADWSADHSRLIAGDPLRGPNG
jgi:hypothetical protein